jgi:DnaJ-class molecular chaperone
MNTKEQREVLCTKCKGRQVPSRVGGIYSKCGKCSGSGFVTLSKMDLEILRSLHECITDFESDVNIAIERANEI